MKHNPYNRTSKR